MSKIYNQTEHSDNSSLVESDTELTVGQLRDLANNPALDDKLDAKVRVTFYISPDVPSISTDLVIFDVSLIKTRADETILTFATFSEIAMEEIL